MASLTQNQSITKHFNPTTNLPRALILLALISLVCGTATGYFLSRNSTQTLVSSSSSIEPTADSAGTVTKNCKDYDQGILKLKPKSPNSDDYSEGTHLLEREGKTPVTLTSSYVDLSKFEGKKIKVYGETQKALKAGWLMDVCKVEEIK